MKVYLNIKETERLESTAQFVRDRLLIRMLRRLGCRISEALTIEVENIDFEHATVSIEHLKSRIQLACPKCNAKLGRTHSFCPRCGEKVNEAVAKQQGYRKMRTLHLDEDTLKMLRDYIDQGGPVLRNGKRLLFGINRHRSWQILRECAERADLPPLTNPYTGKTHGVSPHRLRDAFAVMAVQHDDSTDGIRMLQEWLGHASIATTMRYRKVSGRELREWFLGLPKNRERENG